MLPAEVREMLLKVGEVDWCAFDPASPEELGKEFQIMIERTHKTHGLEGDQVCHFVSTKDNLSVAMVGTSPNSGVISSIIAAGWNYLLAQARIEHEELQT